LSAPFRVADVSDWADARILRGDPQHAFSGASIDSRSVGAEELFVAIEGPRHDGHDHLLDAAGRGASGVLIAQERPIPDALPANVAVLAAADTTRALGALAAGHRSLHRGPVVAITGSNGKTTTKEMCAAILEVRAPCLKTQGNLNNAFGLPLTLLRREDRHRTLVVELGMNHRGEIAALVEIARPTVGLVTNIGTAHIEHLGSREEIALENGDLVAGLDAAGTAVLNADDPLVLAQASRTPASVLTFGCGASADIRAEAVHAGEGFYRFSLAGRGGRNEIRVAGLGDTTVANALAAAAAALAAGASHDDVAAGLAAYRPIGGRLEPVALDRGILVIDDTYNANPQSMEVALRVLVGALTPSGGRHVAVVGDMGELGAQTEEAHRQTGALAASLGVDEIVAVGRHADCVAEGAQAAGLSPDRIHPSDDWEQSAEALTKRLSPGDRVLVKGSRAMRMERIVDRITEAIGRAH
jgi:UDP-N-acetylmuramoyl-tripeptide--D-alanyl-D-alanine ligase